MLRKRLNALLLEFSAEGIEDGVVYDEVFSILLDQMCQSAAENPKEAYWCAYERYDQATRFSGKLDQLTLKMRMHFISNIY